MGDLLRRFVVSHVGECSFCGKRDRDVSAFAAVPHRDYRICGMCLGLCLEVTCELDKREEREAVAAQLARLEPEPELDERVVQAARAGDVEGMVEVLRELGHSDVDIDQLRAVRYSRQSERGCAIVAGRRGSAEDACSFCDAAQAQGGKLLKGPAVAICDRCIDDASADVLGAMLPP